MASDAPDAAVDAEDAAHMGEALAAAEAALAALEVPVGCVFVHPRRGVLGRGHNNTVASCNATRHAELEAIDTILAGGNNAADLAECTLYVTVEPCIMCASALRQLRVQRPEPAVQPAHIAQRETLLELRVAQHGRIEATRRIGHELERDAMVEDVEAGAAQRVDERRVLSTQSTQRRLERERLAN